MAHYALVSPVDEVTRIEPATRIDPTVSTRPGWRWLPVTRVDQPALSRLQHVVENLVVVGSEVQQTWTVHTRAPTSTDVNSERDRRIAAYPFGGHVYQFDAESQTNVAGAGTLALAAIIAGAEPGDLRWADQDRDFAWIAADNTPVVMDAHATLAFAQAAARWKADHIYRARGLKDTNPIPADYTADARWPS